MKPLLLILTAIVGMSLAGSLVAETIYEVQHNETTQGSGDDCYPSPLVGNAVTISGVVTAVESPPYTNFWLEDPANGLWSGIFVYDNTVHPSRGDSVTITGDVSEYYGMTELQNITSSTTHSSGNALPDTIEISTGTLAGGCSAMAEAYEGLLVRVSNVVVTQTVDGYGQWYVDDGSGPCQIEDGLFYYDPGLGDTIGAIIGVVTYAFDEYEINPRDGNDIIPAERPHIISTSPAQNELNVAIFTDISIVFDVDMDEATINDSTFLVNARSTGLRQGTITYDGPTKTAKFDAIDNFAVGEVVTVVMTTGIQSSLGGVPLGNNYVWSFTVKVEDGSATFELDSAYTVGPHPRSVFAADLDGDGDLDLATTSQTSDSVSVLLNNGDGTFALQSAYPVGDCPFSVFAADLDGDAHLDLATANLDSDNVSVLLNKGDGTFAPDSAYPVGIGPWSVFAADLDGDGDLDLTTANSSSNNVSVLLNNGDGTFASDSTYPTGDIPTVVFAADLDGDGCIDLTTANWMSDNVSVLLNNGDGTFASDSTYQAGDNANSVFAADLDGDGDLDLATTNTSSNNVSVLLNYGNGTFAPQSIYSVGIEPRRVFAADLDGDGDIDLATANFTSYNVSVLLNNGDGTFASDSTYPAGYYPTAVFAADLDGDGDMDLAVSNWMSFDGLSVLLNFHSPQLVSTSPAQNELNVSVSNDISVTFDVDMDEATINDSTFLVNARSTGLHQGTISYHSTTKTATLDPVGDFDVGEVVTVVLTTGIQSSLGVPLGGHVWSFTVEAKDGYGTFILDSAYAAAALGPATIIAADLDGDGDLDLATANENSNDVSVFLNLGDGTFAPASTYPAGEYPVTVFAADLDGDADIDLATANEHSDNVSVFLNLGDGTFAPRTDYPVGGHLSSMVYAADLDGDGDMDLATGDYGSDNVSVLLNNGDGTFAPASTYPAGDGSSSPFAADLDGDGDLDLATTNSGSDNVSVLLNDGDGIFTSDSTYPVGDRPTSVFVTDLDGDGDLDLATANNFSDDVSVLLNNGNGTFAPQSAYPAGDYSVRIFAADLDGDGDIDLATANGYSDDVSVLLNNGDGTFAPDSTYPAGAVPLSVFAADLDGDGDLDLATACVNSNKVLVFLNEGGVGVDESEPLVPQHFSLSQNYPNPFNPATDIRYALPTDCRVRLEIYNLLGQKVATLVNEGQTAGHKSVHWDSRSLSGGEVSSGIYFYRLQAGDYLQTRKMILLR